MKKKPKQQQYQLGNEQEEKDSNSFDVDYLFLLSGYAVVVESAFIKAKKEESVVPIKSVEDIYIALTDRETLDKLLSATSPVSRYQKISRSQDKSCRDMRIIIWSCYLH
jgi:hypothetical protein